MAGKGKGNYYKSKPKASKAVTEKEVKKIVDKKMNMVIETKIIDNMSEAIILYHNVPQTIESDCFYCTQGIADTSSTTANRIGDSIYAKKCWFKMLFDQYQDRPNLVFRITVIRIKAGTAPINPSTVLGHPNSGNYMINHVNTELSGLHTEDPIAYDKRFVVNNGISGNTNLKDCHFFKEFNINVNRKLKYLEGNYTVSGPFTLQVIVTAYDSYGSLVTDAVCRLMFARRSYFLDA